MSEVAHKNISGLDELVAWFGRIPRFHDAKILGVSLHTDQPSTIRIHAWQMTDEKDEKGYFILDRHVVVTISLEQVTSISLTDFNLPGIIYDLELSNSGDEVQIAWTGSYGVDGTLRAKRARIDLKPGKP